MKKVLLICQQEGRSIPVITHEQFAKLMYVHKYTLTTLPESEASALSKGVSNVFRLDRHLFECLQVRENHFDDYTVIIANAIKGDDYNAYTDLVSSA